MALLRSKENAVAVVIEGETRHMYIRHHEKNSRAVVYKDFPGALDIYASHSSELERLVVGFCRSREIDDKDHDFECSAWKGHACFNPFLPEKF